MSNALVSKENDCRSCYKCIRNCPTKSISFQNGQASIIANECVLCGTCYLVCPQSCKVIRDDTAEAKKLLSSSEEVIASVAPSFLASFPGVSFITFKKALISLGFSDAEETAIGATIVKKEYDHLVDSKKQDIIISTCCHSINLLIEKHYPDLTKYLAPVLSPMLAHAKDIKKRHPAAKVIFIGPCISKKNEIEMYPGYDDVVLTFLEIQKMFDEKNIKVENDLNPKANEESLARLFPIEGGILDTMDKGSDDYEYLSFSGMEEAMNVFKDIEQGKVHHAFIEMSSCSGSCVNGPAISASARQLVTSYLSIKRSAGKKDFVTDEYKEEDLKKSFPAFSVQALEPTEEAIEGVLRKIGKRSKKDELNCSSCGYATCRDKAKAVLAGKATLEMCLPFLMEKARSFSNSIVEESEDAIIVLNESFDIQLANPSMCKLVGAKDSKDLIGKSVSSILDPESFGLALGGTPIKNQSVYLPEYEKYLVSNITYEPKFHILIGVYRDVTDKAIEKAKQKEIAAKAASITSAVVEKNMRAVQEIASLLGESTAETKIALTNLTEVLKKEDKDNG